MSKNTTGAEKCLLHGPIHSYEECKVLKEYSKNYSTQRPRKDIEALPTGKTKCGKSVNQNRRVKEAKIMEHGDPIPKKNKGEMAKNRKSEIAKANPEDGENTYGIEHIKIG